MAQTSNDPAKYSHHRLILVSVLIFLAALGVRLLTWHDARILEAAKVQSSVTSDYKRVAQLLADGGVTGFFSSSSPLASPDNLGHPPGYSILIALAKKTISDSDATLQHIQIFFDALAAVVLFLILGELISLGAATIAGLLAAFSPQFAWNSVVLLPDTLAVLPILLSVYCLARALKRPRLILIITAGALIGISCWLRANALLLPIFIAVLVFFIFQRERRLRYSLSFIAAALLIILPLTIRNGVVFGHFIPLSLGAGQTFLEGIADYDKGQRFRLPNTDLGIMNQEAEAFNRPDYRDTLFGPDGIQRERMRMARGLGMVRSHPVWFAGVMVRRAGSMLRLERARLVATDPPVTHSLQLTETANPIWMQTPQQVLTTGTVLSPKATMILSTDGQSVIIRGVETDDTKYGKQFATAPVAVQQDSDYLWQVPIRLEAGRVRVGVESSDEKVLFAATVVDTAEVRPPQEQPTQLVQLPFVSGNAGSAGHVRLVVANEGSDAPAVIYLGDVRLFALGPSSFGWTRYPRLLIHGVQKLFLTAIMLPLALAGVALVAWKRRWRVLAVLLIVPAYYLCVQSATHTEYRYILALYYFLFAFAGVTLSWASTSLSETLRARVSNHPHHYLVS